MSFIFYEELKNEHKQYFEEITTFSSGINILNEEDPCHHVLFLLKCKC